eukprot:scaffold11300_cov124-Skeletonema_marinoi.AAC.1
MKCLLVIEAVSECLRERTRRTGLSIALGVLNAVNEIKKKKSMQAEGDDDELEAYCIQMYMGAFAHLRSHNITFILELTRKEDSFPGGR